ncbi:MAG TPA: ABC transporter ATP-binding protein [Actinomycetota bacterium]|nr:ABC transporter ATP-binding protein [Actinomycetota bacterium]
MSSRNPLRSPVWLLVRSLPKASRGHFAAFVALRSLDGLLPLVFWLQTGLLVDRVPAAVGAGLDSAPGRSLLTSLAILSGLYVVQRTLNPAGQVIAQSLGSRLSAHLHEHVMVSCLRPSGIAHLEDPALADTLQRARNFEWGLAPLKRTIQAAGQQLALIVSGLGSVALVATFRWWAALAVAGAWVLTHASSGRDEYVEARRSEQFRELERRGDYYYQLAVEAPAAKEIRLFGLGDWIADRFTHLKGSWYDRLTQLRRGYRRRLTLSFLAAAGANTLVLVALARSAAGGGMGAGRLVVLVQAVLGIRSLSHSEADWWLTQGSAALPDVLGLRARATSAHSDLRGSRPADGMPRRSITFEGVGFAYPGSGRGVFGSLDLAIPAGRSLAIVGVNGAGKTTLVKLLARLYDPDSGRISVDGHDLRQIDPVKWRLRLAAIFQDFVRYELPASDNVALARPDAGGKLIARAAGRAGALDLIQRLPEAWDTILSRSYEGGTDLSGGQWQRIALARALLAVECGAGVLILDEPTANLDVRVEAEIFDRFLDLTRGLTTVLISHRFSSVRRADRICVLDGGRVVEEGSHDELMARDGHYASMFSLQASRFLEDSDVP